MDGRPDRADEFIARLLATVDYLRVTVGPPTPDLEWLDCDRLVGDPALLKTIARSTAAERGTEAENVAMSLFVQGYAFRVASLAIGGWLLDEVVVDIDPAVVSIALGRGRPNAVRLERAELAVDRPAPVESLHRQLIDGHLARLVETAHDACRIGAALLWSNVGASCASSFGAFVDAFRNRGTELRDRLDSFTATARPELARSGRVVHVGSRWGWERNACCLWYQTAGGFKCEDCSLWTPAERRARYDAALAAEGAK